LDKHGELTLENSVLTCLHVVNKERKYEYIEQSDGCVESFTCSGCLDMLEENPEEAKKYLMCVCRKCFVESRMRSDK
ncbi:MAG: hypothetical protein R3321_05685, partial [Nitrososphaeraceae archaeon]|nr:hypothetical protein [Nitrososphaeraceae archaeon]